MNHFREKLWVTIKANDFDELTHVNASADKVQNASEWLLLKELQFVLVIEVEEVAKSNHGSNLWVVYSLVFAILLLVQELRLFFLWALLIELSKVGIDKIIKVLELYHSRNKYVNVWNLLVICIAFCSVCNLGLPDGPEYPLKISRNYFKSDGDHIWSKQIYILLQLRLEVISKSFWHLVPHRISINK